MTAHTESVSIPLGQPVFVHALRYTALFDRKPFSEALLIYTDNGAYKIVSPGEDHYGSYVSYTDVAEGPQHVIFLSWPSEDWDRNVASHTLTFNPDSAAFTQVLVLPGNPVPRSQYGYALPIPDPHSVDMTASWDRVRETYAETFTQLELLATARQP
ncbi:hypothetical protein CH256_14260 [Rhodococcus sp. 05-2254-6]|uniref:hypothetical protein n=1 Tax=Rhodococcus sp. 05-2254-6 TaxID=2022489 RepID=UPI000B9AB221|nr:hypothetical protein [Rhodococcus sp. 05-2254-6]OZE30512.1 hypothetical protein CH256_14260 [Rhodococcus sp. 05-2254-6]